MKKYAKLLDNFKAKKILVIGDSMLDVYLHGNATRISPEAPVPILLKNNELKRLGGAANVANNLSELGAEVTLVTIIGEDNDGKEFLSLLSNKNISSSYVYRIFERPTIVKMRILAGHQQIVRIDTEVEEEIDPYLRTEFIRILYELIPTYDGILISDYGKGVLNMELIPFVIERAVVSGKPVIVDPKPKNAIYYENATVLTPNHKEAEEISGIKFKDEEGLEEAGRAIINKLGVKYLLITLGEKGMTLFEKDKKRVDIPTQAKSVYDVTGAGDLVASIVALGLSSGFSFYDSCYLANTAAGIEVSKLGNVSVSIEELKSILE